MYRISATVTFGADDFAQLIFDVAATSYAEAEANAKKQLVDITSEITQIESLDEETEDEELPA